MIRARHKEWGIEMNGDTLNYIAEALGCEVSDLEILWEKTEQDFWLEKLPVEFRSAFSYYAYQKGHSAGEEETLSILKEMIEEFLPSIKKFEERLTNKS